MNVNNKKPDECCGCSGCAAVCPQNAIVLKPDSEGFLYPIVDETLCIHCEKCIRLCNHKTDFKKSVISAVAAKNTVESQVLRSSSGGVSRALCEAVISKGGVVYGVRYDDNNEVITWRASEVEECDCFYGSKYVQTNPVNTFEEVEKDLNSDRIVLYFGTSCHIAGLKSYLELRRSDTSKLYTVDLICHGVPSPLIFQEYIHFLNSKKDVDHFDFRTKTHPWGYGSINFGCTIYYKDGTKEFDTARAWIFLILFFSNNCLRPHCHKCEFAGLEKPSDITVADYWGCKETESDFFDEKGVSAVLLHTEKGKQLLSECKSLEMKTTSVEAIRKKQGNLDHPSPVSPHREDFWNLYYQDGFLEVAKKYGGWNFKGIIHRTKAYRYYYNFRKR